MRCDEFELRLQDVLDERREPASDSALAAHGAECAACRTLAASLRGALQGLAALPRPAPSDSLTARVLAALADGPTEALEASPAATRTIVELPPRRAVRDGASLWTWTAVAALVLLVAYPVWRWTHPADPGAGPVAQDPPKQSPAPTQQLAATPPHDVPKQDVPSRPAEPLPSFSELAEESKGSTRQLARDTQRSLSDALALASLWEKPSPKADLTSAGDDWLRGMAGGVAPIAHSTVDTFNALRGIVPTGKDTKL